MGWELAGIILIGSLIAILLLGLPVAFTFMVVVFIGNFLILGPVNGPSQFVLSFYQAVANFNLAPIPFFILMGDILYRSGLAVRAISAIGEAMGAIPARLSFIAVAGGAMFGAISGSTLASTAIHSSLLLPEMRNKGYKGKLAFGPILAGGGLAMIIPPSSLSVVYAATANISVADILIAGILPGIIMAIGYSTVIIIRYLLDPAAAPNYEMERIPWSRRLKVLLVDVVPLVLIIATMVAAIVLGLATPTESAALAAVASVIVVALYKKFSWSLFYESILSTVQNTGMIFFITVASIGFSRLLGFSGVSIGLLNWVATLNIPSLALIGAMMFIVIILGMFMDQIAIMMITIPIFSPIVTQIGFDMVAFAILMLIALRIGLITPPFGLELFLMKGYLPAETKMPELWTAALPFILSDMVVITIIMFFPIIATIVPQLMVV